MEIRERLYTIMVNQSSLSRSTVTESMAKFAIQNLEGSVSLEKTIVRILLAIEDKYRNYFEAYQKEMELQRIAAQTLSQLIQRYKITMQVDTSCMCPNIYEIESEEAILNKYYLHYQVIVSSNKNQGWAIHHLRQFVLIFRRECSKLDHKAESSFIMGDAFHRPIKFFMELVDELFAYFYSGHLQLDCAARLLDPLDLSSLEHYQKLLAPNEDFDEYFLHNISFCQCLRPPPRCATYECHQKIKDQAEPYISQAKKARCLRRFNKMANLEVEDPKRESGEVKREPSVVSTHSEKLAKSISRNSRDSTQLREPLPAVSQQHELDLTNQLRNAINIIC
ncbi:uncharacterized protein LOC108087837 [Drosophila ficusphila]|uniref:uncharacterized protein LOC108087837 n=1 Tax=Drosophila ficusphila TaxID=30025 RepID=UPI0007E78BE4|nr:uncharacterized protein LOC108087837 [Drosophila ficusphila]